MLKKEIIYSKIKNVKNKRKKKQKKRGETMLTKEHANGITLERERERERESIQFKNIATKVAAFCVQKIKEYSKVKKEVSYTE